jgi:hypothetical protein
MTRLFLSTVIGILTGIGLGLLIGWQIAPVEYINSPMSDLAQRHKDDYTLMIAAGYLTDGDVSGAIERLRVLGVDNVPAYVQDTTERFITNSRDIDEIRQLVALSEGLGRLTPPMENFRQLSLSESNTP